MEERILVVPLRKARRGSSSRFAPKAVRYLRNFIKRHLKAEEVVIGVNLNNFIWSRGIRNPPRRVEVRAAKKGNVAYVELASLREEEWRKFIEGKQEKKEVIEKREEKKEEKKAEERQETEEKEKEVVEEEEEPEKEEESEEQ